MYRDTSRAAWQAWTAEVSGRLDRRIMRVIAEHDPHGIICEDIEKALGEKHQAVSGNLRHLVERRYVRHKPGGYGRTSSGRKAMQWILNDPHADAPAVGTAWNDNLFARK